MSSHASRVIPSGRVTDLSCDGLGRKPTGDWLVKVMNVLFDFLIPSWSLCEESIELAFGEGPLGDHLRVCSVTHIHDLTMPNAVRIDLNRDNFPDRPWSIYFYILLPYPSFSHRLLQSQ